MHMIKTHPWARLLLSSKDERVRSKTVFRMILVAALVCALLEASVAAAPRHGHASRVMGFLALGIAVCVLACNRSDVAVHLCVVAYVSLYQRGVSTAPLPIPMTGAEEALEWLAISVPTMAIAGESLLLYYLVLDRRAPETFLDLANIDAFREYYGYVGGAALLAAALVPTQRTGIYHLPAEMHVAMVTIWLVQAMVEESKSRIAKGFALPHIACKCAPLLYLRPVYWPVLLIFIAINMRIVRMDASSSKSEITSI
jgi:uncharacterized membrane protein YhdT